MKKLKRLITFTLTIALCLGLFVSTASAATQQEAVDWAWSQVGKSINFDGYYGPQCVDLTMKYCYQVFGFWIGGNGCDYRDYCDNKGHSANKLPAGWTRTKYSKGDIPQPGDIIVYIPGSPGYTNKNGHVSICVSANANNYTCISQSGGKTKKVDKSSYSGVWGFIHPVYSEKGKPTVVFSNYQVRSLADTSAEPYATVNATGAKVTEVGMYIGLAKDDLTKLGSDNGAASYKKNMWYNTTKYGYPLESGTTYYYQPYAVVGGETYWGDTKNFTTTGTKKKLESENNQNKSCTAHVKGDYIWFDGDHPHKDAYYCAVCGEKFLDDSSSNYYDQCPICNPPKKDAVTFSNYQVRELTSTSAEPYATATAKTGKVARVGMYIGIDKNNLTELGTDNGTPKNYKNMWYNTTKYNYPLKPSTTYYYQPFAEVDGVRYYGDIKSFTTKEPESMVTFSNYKVRNLTATSAEPYATATAKSGKVARVGMYIGTDKNNLTQLGTDNGTPKPYKNMWYNTTKYGYTIKPNTTYYYQPFAEVDGVRYYGDIKSFTTPSK